MSYLGKIIGFLYRVMKPVSRVANGIGLVALAAMMFLTAVDVTLRKVANMPIIGSYELVQMMMVTCGAFGLAHCAIEKGHVAVDLVTSRLPHRTRGALGIITGLIGLVVGIVLTWQAVNYIFILQKSGQMTAVLIVPLYPFVALFAFGCVLYCIVLFIHFFEFVKEGTTR